MKTTKTEERTIKAYLGLMLRGIAMGASDVVPGVSGGTMAFILGIYEELIDSIRTVGQPAFLQAVVKLRIKEAWGMLNWQFLLAVGSGIAIAVLSLAQVLEYLLKNQPIYIWSFFFGLIVASAIVVGKRIKQWDGRLVGGLLIGLVVAFFLVGVVPAQTPETWWFLILSGAIAICGMILPGISGAFLLVLLGKYEFILGAVKNFELDVILLVAIGAGLGIVSIAQVLGWLFKKYHDPTVALLMGLMVGSLRKVWPWKNDIDWLMDDAGAFILSHGEKIVTQQELYMPTFTNNGSGEIIGGLVLALIGFGAILLLDKVAGEEKGH